MIDLPMTRNAVQVVEAANRHWRVPEYEDRGRGGGGGGGGDYAAGRDHDPAQQDTQGCRVHLPGGAGQYAGPGWGKKRAATLLCPYWMCLFFRRSSQTEKKLLWAILDLFDDDIIAELSNNKDDNS